MTFIFTIFNIAHNQGAKKIIFTACPSGKLKLAFTSPDVISTSPKNFCYSNSSQNITCPSGKLKTEFTSPIAKSTSPRLSDSTFFARCKAICRAKAVPSFLSHVKTLSVGVAPGIEPVASHAVVKHSYRLR